MAVISGSAPVSTLQNYQKEVTAYTRGKGRLFCTLKGNDVCHNVREVIAAIGYDSEKDAENPTGSIFSANGAGFAVSWDKVKEYMYVESWLKQGKSHENAKDEEEPGQSRQMDYT